MHAFYLPDLSAKLVLDAEESAHAVKVLRKREGDTLLLTDGKGRLAEARITKAHTRGCELELSGPISQIEKRPYSIHIAISPTKNLDRMEWMVEKCTELGIDKISFLLCENSERKVLKADRLLKKAISAMKQSGNLYLPELNELVSFHDFVKTGSREDQKMIAYVDESHPHELKRILKPNGSYCILIGPEGDFSQEEIQMAITGGFLPVSLGSSRLRTETAGIAACHTCHLIN